MKSNIKKWGIGFFVVAIICLFTSLCLLATTNEQNLILADSTINDEEKASPQDNIPAISETIELNGANLAEQSAKWSTAVTSALTGKHVLVKLINNWTATVEGFITEDMPTTGFLNRIIHVPTGVTITLDLNGKTINRNLKVFKENGGIFLVFGTLIIKDSAYDGERIVNEYNNNNHQGFYSFSDIACGKIRGAKAYTAGGGIWVNGGTLIMEGGMLLDNKTNSTGGAIGARNANIIINHGIIYRNIVEGTSGLAGGGAICLEQGSNLDIYNGIIHSNLATRLKEDDGGAIVATGDECNIRGGIFAHNQADDAGGVIVSRNGIVITLVVNLSIILLE